jgi:hypothetical protein
MAFISNHPWTGTGAMIFKLRGEDGSLDEELNESDDPYCGFLFSVYLLPPNLQVPSGKETAASGERPVFPYVSRADRLQPTRVWSALNLLSWVGTFIVQRRWTRTS